MCCGANPRSERPRRPRPARTLSPQRAGGGLPRRRFLPLGVDPRARVEIEQTPKPVEHRQPPFGSINGPWSPGPNSSLNSMRSISASVGVEAGAAIAVGIDRRASFEEQGKEPKHRQPPSGSMHEPLSRPLGSMPPPESTPNRSRNSQRIFSLRQWDRGCCGRTGSQGSGSASQPPFGSTPRPLSPVTSMTRNRTNIPASIENRAIHCPHRDFGLNSRSLETRSRECASVFRE